MRSVHLSPCQTTYKRGGEHTLDGTIAHLGLGAESGELGCNWEVSRVDHYYRP